MVSYTGVPRKNRLLPARGGRTWGETAFSSGPGKVHILGWLLARYNAPMHWFWRAAIAVGATGALCWVLELAARALGNPDSTIGKATVLTHQARSEDGFRASSDERAVLVGKTGVAVSNLNPAGTALVEGQRLSVVSDGEFIEADSSIEVVAARDFRIVVRRSPRTEG